MKRRENVLYFVINSSLRLGKRSESLEVSFVRNTSLTKLCQQVSTLPTWGNAIRSSRDVKFN